MKDSRCAGISEKDRTVLVTNGLYAFSRNPAFRIRFDVFRHFPVVWKCVERPIHGVCRCVLHLQIFQEEKYMTDIFWQAYCEYYGI